jgi:hypothetical protein
MSSLALARYQWAEGKRLLDAAGDDTARSRHLFILVEAVADELARRVGQTFTLAELAQAYSGSEEWVRDVVVSSMPARSRAGIKDTALVQHAAFALYAQGASDYRP